MMKVYVHSKHHNAMLQCSFVYFLFVCLQELILLYNWNTFQSGTSGTLVLYIY